MKINLLYNSLLLGIGSLAMGILLIIKPEDALLIAVKLFGVILIVVGLIQLIVQLMKNRKKQEKLFPVWGVIQVVIGIVLLIHPEFWTEFFMIVFGVLLVFMAVNQIFSYSSISRGGIKVSFGYYIFPILLAAAGILAVLQPAFLISVLVTYIGICFILYGIVELFSYFSLKK